MDRFKWIQESLLPGGDEDAGQDDLLGEFDGSCNLSPLQRLYGFAGSLVVGFAFMLLVKKSGTLDPFLLYFLIAAGLALVVFIKPIKFAILFTFGNILAVGSTAFLIGPMQQTRMMLDPVRVYATAVYVGSVILALICALWIHSKVLTLLVIIIEMCALIWYSLSYIPFARRMVSELFISCCDTEI